MELLSSLGQRDWGVIIEWKRESRTRKLLEKSEVHSQPAVVPRAAVGGIVPHSPIGWNQSGNVGNLKSSLACTGCWIVECKSGEGAGRGADGRHPACWSRGGQVIQSGQGDTWEVCWVLLRKSSFPGSSMKGSFPSSLGYCWKDILLGLLQLLCDYECNAKRTAKTSEGEVEMGRIEEVESCLKVSCFFPHRINLSNLCAWLACLLHIVAFMILSPTSLPIPHPLTVNSLIAVEKPM